MYPKPVILFYICFSSFINCFSIFSIKIFSTIPHFVCCPRYCISNWIRKLTFIGPFMCSVHLQFSVNKNNK